MPFVRREIFTKDAEIQRILDDLMKYRVAVVPPVKAQELSRHKTIIKIRELDMEHPHVLIGADQKFHQSIVNIDARVKIVKVGNRYVFSL